MNASKQGAIRSAARIMLLDEGFEKINHETFEKNIDGYPVRVFVGRCEVSFRVFIDGAWQHADSRPINELHHILN